MNLHALTGAYVLDALDRSELAAFEAHLPTCADCRAEVASLRDAVVHMAAAEAVAPPPHMRDAVRALVDRTPQVGPLVPHADTAEVQPATTNVTPLRPRPGWRRWPALTAAACIALAVVVGATAVIRAQRDDSQSIQAQVVRIMSAPDAVTHDVDLGSTHLMMSNRARTAALMGSDVPMPHGHDVVYQMWMVHTDGSTAPGPTFMPHDGTVATAVEGDFSLVTEFMVTVEPSGGSATPSGPVVTELRL